MSLRIIALLAALALIGCDQRTMNPVTPVAPATPLPSPPPPANIAGGYSMTITASASCTSLPDVAKTQTQAYDDVVISQEASLTKGTLTLTRPDSAKRSFGVSVGGNQVSIDFGDCLNYGIWGSGGGLFYPVMPTGELATCGFGHVVAEGSAMAGSLDGAISYTTEPGNYAQSIDCFAGDHHLALQRK